MNIVHTESSCGWGGQEIRILEESRGMLKRGHSVTILCPRESQLFKKCSGHGVKAIALPIARKNVKGLLALRKWFHNNPVDIINTHSSTDTWLAALARITLPNSPPIIRTRHISSPIPDNWTSKWLYTKAVKHVVTTGEALRKQVIEQTGATSSHVTSVPTGIDPDRFKPGNKYQARIKLKLNPDFNYIGIVATLRSWKGHLYLLEAFSKLNMPDWRLLIVGDGPYRGVLDQRAEQLDLRERVIFAGQQSNPEDWFRAMDIFCLPSYANEGVPQAILQAMFTGLPVVSTTVGAIGEIITDNLTGITVPSKSANTLKEALYTITTDNDLSRRLGTHARMEVIKQYDYHSMLLHMESILNKTIK